MPKLVIANEAVAAAWVSPPLPPLISVMCIIIAFESVVMYLLTFAEVYSSLC